MICKFCEMPICIVSLSSGRKELQHFFNRDSRCGVKRDGPKAEEYRGPSGSDERLKQHEEWGI